MDTLIQIGVVMTSAPAIWLVGRKSWRTRRLGYICGLLSIPFYFATTIPNGQWGMILITFWYMYSWASGLKNHWKWDEQKIPE